MDKLTPQINPTPVTVKSPEAVSQWYKTETTSGEFPPAELGWMMAQGWKVDTVAITADGADFYNLSRRVLKPESVLQDLVVSYTTAYNEGRILNDTRYDDLVVLFSVVLDKSERSYNFLEEDDDDYEALTQLLIATEETNFNSYDAAVTGDLDDWGRTQRTDVNARFDALLASAEQELINRGMYSSTHFVTDDAGIERERTRALDQVEDTIEQRQLGLKHQVYAALVSVKQRVHDARTRLRVFLHNSKDKQVAVRNAAVDALARLIEGRTDGYPDMASIGRLAANLGAGSPQSYAP